MCVKNQPVRKKWLINRTSVRNMIGMRYMIRTLLFIITIMLGWINIPAQAYLSPSAQNLWPVMSQNFDIPASYIDKSDVQQQIDWDLRNRKYIQRLTVNAKPYLYYVFQETKKYHVPAELALLPMIESGYVPDGDSRAGAQGLWQLMPSTAYTYGVKMNYFYDGRRSTTVSTKVALHFLSYLYQMFDHNWLLALAAYDAGPGPVLEAIKYNQAHGRPTDFWALQLPKETEAYVPKLLALATIIQHPHAYGIQLARVPDKAVTTTVKINKEMNINTIAHLAHTSVNTVQKLNPALNHDVTPPHQIITVVLPAGKKQTFDKHLAAHKAIEKEYSHTHYIVKSGDNLWVIAHRFGDTETQLEQWNHINLNTPLRIGEQLQVSNKIVTPPAKKKITSITHVVATAKKKITTVAHITHVVPVKHIVFSKQTKKTIASNEHLYIVKPGDNLHQLAAEFNTTTYYIIEHNHLKTTDLSIGEHLELPNA